MAIVEITGEDLVRQLRHALGMPLVASAEVDDALLAGLVRRAAAILCPCSRATLATAVSDSLEGIVAESECLRERAEDTVEGLVVLGDLLDLSQATTNDLEAKESWVFSAPPGFVVRRSGTVLLLGMAQDEGFPLPSDLREQIIFNRFTRLLRPRANEQLPKALVEMGLLQHAEGAWLKTPKDEPASVLLDKVTARLAAQSPSGDIVDLLILDPASKVDFYKGRWKLPKTETGFFVARRPQEYGAALWGVVQLLNGKAQKFLEFPTKANRWRACDEAWHIQLAIDHQRGVPQRYRRREAGEGAFLEFFSPIPMWAERHLAVVGEGALASKCLFSYFVPQDELRSEEEFIQKRLWLVKVDDTKIMEE